MVVKRPERRLFAGPGRSTAFSTSIRLNGLPIWRVRT
jgi:hypothetical protein